MTHRIRLLAILFTFGISHLDSVARCLGEETPDAQETIARFSRAWTAADWGPGKAKYMQALDDDSWQARMNAVQALVRLGAAATDELRRKLREGPEHERILAAQTIGYLPDESFRADLEHAAEHDSSAAVRLYAVDSLGMLGGKQSHPLLKRLAASESNRDVKRHLAYALERDGAAIDEDVAQQLKDSNLKLMNSAKLGKPAPDFELRSIKGEKVRLSDYRGKKHVVLVFIYGDT